MEQLVINLEFNRKFKLSPTRKRFPITDALKEEVLTRLRGIHNWSSFAEDHGIRYMAIINLKNGRSLYLNRTSIEICEALGIDLSEYYVFETAHPLKVG